MSRQGRIDMRRDIGAGARSANLTFGNRASYESLLLPDIKTRLGAGRMREVALIARDGDAASSRSGTGSRNRSLRAGRHGHHRPHARQHYFAFLSYSHADQAMAEWLHEALESFRVPRRLVGRLTENGVIPRRLTPVFRDRGELAASDNLTEEIEEALAGSRFLVVLCSPAAVASKWTNAEITAFKRLHPDGEIFAAIVAGEPFASEMPGRETEECFPPALLGKYDSRGRPTGKRAEPIAADLRGDDEARRLGLMQIIAGMLGVGLDELVQREGKRRQHRMQLIAVASLVGMLIASALAFVAIQSRDAARDQRREAESLVAFMIGDLKEELEPIGKLDALGGVGARVLAYYSKQDASELSDAGLRQRAQALSLTAHVANLRNDKNTALQLYRQAMQGTAEAVRRDPDDPQRLFEHAQNVFWIGDIARDLGQAGQAEAAYREYKRLADRMVAIEPDNLRWRMEVLYAEENIGIILRNQRRFAESARQFTAALGPMQSLAAIDPSNSTYQTELSTVLAWSADAQRDLGRLDEAIRLRERQIALLRRPLESGDTNVEFRRHLIAAHQGLAILLSSRGQPERGIEQLRLAVAEAGRLIPIEPDNVLWKGFAAQARLQLAADLIALNRHADASPEAAAGCRLSAQIEDRDPGRSWRHLRTDCLAARSRLALRSGSDAEALKLAEQALASARTERRPDPVSVRYRIAAAYRHLGDVRRQLGDREAARAAWTEGMAQLPRNVAERPVEMSERAKLLERLGRASEARPLVERLGAIGYKSVT